MLHEGVFITFEGTEGVGKSTQIKKISDFFLTQGKKVICTREPGGTPFAESIRDLFLQHTPDIITEVLLLIAARKDHLDKVIKPSLEKGYVVLCDRYIDSTLVYQGALLGLSEKEILFWHEKAECLFWPRLTFIYQQDDLQVGLSRKSQEETHRFEKKPLSYHQVIQKRYQEIAKKYPERCRLISVGQMHPGEIFDMSLKFLLTFL